MLLICRFHVSKAEGLNAIAESSEHFTVSDLKDCPEVGIETRIQWASKVVECFKVVHDSIQPWDFLGELDGSVKLLPLPATEGAVYPARFRIPPEMICCT